MGRMWLADGRQTDVDGNPQPVQWFDEGPAGTADTVAIPVTPTPSEAEHQAALAEIDLPAHPLRLRPSRWAGARRWTAETLQVALGAVLGTTGVLALLAWLAR